MMDFLKSLNIESKLSPRKNTEVIWFYIFLPALVAYFYILAGTINAKPIIGWVAVHDVAASTAIFGSNAKVELISHGLQATNGPVYIADEAESTTYLLFTDTVLNNIYKWEEGRGWFTVGRTRYIENSGCSSSSGQEECLAPTTSTDIGSTSILRKGESSTDLIVCQLGGHSIDLFMENGTRTSIVTHYNGKLLNRPSDAVWSPEGHLYFTDISPPTSSSEDDKDKNHIDDRFVPHGGVYMIPVASIDAAMFSGQPTPDVLLLDKSLSAPSGLAFSPDYSQLYVSNDEKGKRGMWKRFDVTDKGALVRGKEFANAGSLADTLSHTVRTCDGSGIHDGNLESIDPSTDRVACVPEHHFASTGSPKGLAVDIHGNLFATGPGGVVVLSSEGSLISSINVANASATNVALGADGYLYITADGSVSRVYVHTKPTRILSGYKR